MDFRLTIADCPGASGACCLPDGGCAQLTEADCTNANGTSWTVNDPCTPSPCPYLKGDTNCSHSVDVDDVSTFTDAMLGLYTGCDVTLADMNSDGKEDGVDIAAFISAVLPM